MEAVLDVVMEAVVLDIVLEAVVLEVQVTDQVYASKGACF